MNVGSDKKQKVYLDFWCNKFWGRISWLVTSFKKHHQLKVTWPYQQKTSLPLKCCEQLFLSTNQKGVFVFFICRHNYAMNICQVWKGWNNYLHLVQKPIQIDNKGDETVSWCEIFGRGVSDKKSGERMDERVRK